MFQDIPETTPGAQITKKPHIKIHASQPGFRNRTSDRLVVVPPANQMPGPKTTANQQGPQHGNLSATRAAELFSRLREYLCILIQILLKAVCTGPMNNKPELMPITNWHQIYRQIVHVVG